MASKELYEKAFQYPTQQESIEIQNHFPPVKELFLSHNDIEAKEEYHKVDVMIYVAKHDIINWINRLNNKLGKLKFSYILLKFYYLKGIPDEQWKVELEAGGTKFFPDFKDEGDHYIHFLFKYSSENFYYHYVSALDCIAHLLNIYYNLSWGEKEVAFKKDLFKKLQLKDKDLAQSLGIFSESIGDIREDRNGLAHRFPLNEVDFRSKKNFQDGKEVVTMGSAHYTNSREVLTKIERSVELLSDTLKNIEKTLSSNSDQ
ncbi:Cthe_2314 family HEPN domain-containing protein [Pontibacter ruber]|uniref:Cthe_2314 family HEPN domain-containing protein n=1 Tax=Pontibacter ruber TaxID=1343895 RepID=A0ABW5CTS1_9BACT|nr:Cthe_2314 family HEPN domain-containing protein [Pontibacter ruber]